MVVVVLLLLLLLLLGCIVLLDLVERGGVIALRLGLVVVLLPLGEGGLGAGETGAEREVEIGEVGGYAGDVGGGGAGEEGSGYAGVEGWEARVN